MSSVIERPMITEKASLQGNEGIYVFKVGWDSTKTEIKREVQGKFGVKVKSIRTLRARGGTKVTKQGISRLERWKKAYVQLQKGEKIALFEGA